MDILLSAYGRASAVPSPVNQMMADFATDFRDGADINLGVGYVNERTIPEDLIREALDAIQTNRAKYRQAFNYGGPQGSANLIESIRRFHAAQHAGELDEALLGKRRIVVGPSGATSLLDAIADILEPGVVITSDPAYYIYANTLERKGFEVLAIPEDARGIDLDRLEQRLAQGGPEVERIAFFYIVTVNNPSCAILSNDRRRRLVEIATKVSRRQNRAIPVFFDMAYELLRHDPAIEPFESALPWDELGLVYEIGTLSKILAPALRIGYMIGPPGVFMNAIVQKTSDVGFSAPLITQEIASYLLDHHALRQLQEVNAGYRAKALAVKASLDAHLADFLEEIRGGSAGFYYYLTFKNTRTDTSSLFFRYLTRTTGDPGVDGPPGNKHPRVIYIPGEYCVHPRGERVETGRRQLRLSYGFEEVPAIEAAIALMREAVLRFGDK